MLLLDIIADNPSIEKMYGVAALFVFKLFLVALVVYLGSQAISSLPMAGRFLSQPIGQLVMHALIILACGLLAFWVPSMRILHQTGFVESSEILVWPDIVLTGLAISRLTHFWHLIYRMIEKKTIS